MTSQTQVSAIQSQNQQQPIVPIQQLLQHSSQPECSPADVGLNERRPNGPELLSLITKRINNCQRNSVHVRHKTLPLSVKRRHIGLCKI